MYWRRNGDRYFICSKGVDYRKIAAIESIPHTNSELYNKRLSLFICAFPPDRRRRDLDNLLKCIGDSLQHAGLYKDDSQIDCIYIKRMPELLNQVVIKIEECT